MLNEITLGKWEDCLPRVESHSVRLALLDLPYNTTENEYDKEPPVDLNKLWQELERILLPDGAAVFTASQPFTSKLVSSKLDWFKYDIIWVKTQATGHLNSEVEPMRQHEEILVFGKGRIVYNPQIEPKLKENIRPVTKRRALTENYVLDCFARKWHHGACCGCYRAKFHLY
jgi:site-specific DNA-methyltransferase (adenine-specific)